MKIITKDDLYDALGITSRGSSWTSALVGFGVGALCGAAVALLFAPKAGEELRESLMRKTRETVESMKEGSRPNA